IVQCSQLGLEPGSALGHAYLLPFGNKNEKSGKKNVQLIIGYRGMIDLARRSGQIASLSARVVREGDEFNFEFGLDEKLIHRPGENEDAPVT
ncbi:recombinase RecT, partial [Escherichia coli]|nr:recombinase RecT [Escherichia coli]